MAFDPDEEEEDGPLSVPPPGDPDGDAPTVLEDEGVDDLAPPSSPSEREHEAPPEDLPFIPPAWDDGSEPAEPAEPSSEIGELLDDTSGLDDDAPLGDVDGEDEDVALPDEPADPDDPFDPGGDDGVDDPPPASAAARIGAVEIAGRARTP